LTCTKGQLEIDYRLDVGRVIKEHTDGFKISNLSNIL
jgi:hypothetical protein